MATTEEPTATNVDSPTDENEATKKAARESKSKPKPKPKKPSAPRKPASYPPYQEMINDAIVTLKEKSGSSQYAIAKFLEEKHKQLPSNFRKLLLYHSKKLVASGKLVKVKGSYKLPPIKSSAPKPSPVEKKTVAPKPKPKPQSKSKPNSKPKPKAAPTAKETKTTKSTVAKAPAKAKTAAKPKPKLVTKSKAAAKPKAAPAKAKQSAAAKPMVRPAKASRTSTRTSPGKNVPAPKPAPKKAAIAKKAPVKIVKPKSVKSPAKKVATLRKGRK